MAGERDHHILELTVIFPMRQKQRYISHVQYFICRKCRKKEARGLTKSRVVILAILTVLFIVFSSLFGIGNVQYPLAEVDGGEGASSDETSLPSDMDDILTGSANCPTTPGTSPEERFVEGLMSEPQTHCHGSIALIFIWENVSLGP